MESSVKTQIRLEKISFVASISYLRLAGVSFCESPLGRHGKPVLPNTATTNLYLLPLVRPLFGDEVSEKTF